jgi:hypothetical protein
MISKYCYKILVQQRKFTNIRGVFVIKNTPPFILEGRA